MGFDLCKSKYRMPECCELRRPIYHQLSVFINLCVIIVEHCCKKGVVGIMHVFRMYSLCISWRLSDNVVVIFNVGKLHCEVLTFM